VVYYLLLGLLLLLVALLMVPINFYGQGYVTDIFTGEIGLDWAGGLIAARWVLPSQPETRSTLRMGPWVKTTAKSPGKPRRSKDKSRGQDSSKFDLNVVKNALDKQVFLEILIFVKSMWQSLRLCLDLEGRYGTDDPATTGFIAAFIGIFNHSNSLRLTPQFAEAGLNLSGNVRGRFIPGQLIWSVGRFLFKKPIRKVWWLMIRKKNSNK
jgi:hypothetical protein